MKKLFSRHWPFLLLLSLFSAFHFWGIGIIPFHPDESTQIYMSQDFTKLFTQPASLAWEAGENPTPEQILRELDAPIAKYLIGLGRTLSGQPPLPSDWDWGASWEENQQAGALPSPALLLTARISISLLLPFSLTFIYLTASRLANRYIGLLAAILLGTNALVLLHARRAMAEGVLLLGVTFLLWSLLDGHKHPWLTGLAMAIAFNAKQSTLALFPIGALAVIWLPQRAEHRLRQIITNTLQYFVVFLLVFLLLNPLYWKNPIQAGQASWNARKELSQLQMADLKRLAPHKALATPQERAIALIANLYLTPPSFAEFGNYLGETHQAEENYLSVQGHALARGLLPGGLLLVFMLGGVVLAVVQSPKETPTRRRQITLLILAFFVQIAAILIAIPIPWQRYTIPIIPFLCVWTAYGVAPFFPKSKAEKEKHA
ncbi:MAG: hypothetical protein U9O54_03855 [Chloroflexota bacterium]|nr:hypothetical protein [Chloroflexota bacterium]